MVWGADAVREDVDRVGFLSSSLGGGSGSSFPMLPTMWVSLWTQHTGTGLNISRLRSKSQLWAGGVAALLLSQRDW